MTTAKPDALFIDTNILVFASAKGSEAHSLALEKLAGAALEGRELWVSPQVIREYIAVLTKPGLYTRPPSRAEVLGIAEQMTRHFHVAAERADTVVALTSLLRQSGQAGRGIHDCNIVATMQVHGITALLTDNSRNFSAFGGLVRVEVLR